MIRNLLLKGIKLAIDNIVDPWYEKHFHHVRTEFNLQKLSSEHLERALQSCKWNVRDYETDPSSEVLIRKVFLADENGRKALTVVFVEAGEYSHSAEEHRLPLHVFLQSFTPEDDIIITGDDM